MWTLGPYSLSAGQQQRYGFIFAEGDAGLQVIAPHPLTSGAELQYTLPGVVLSSACKLTYRITVKNVGSSVAEFNIRGTAI